MIYTNLRGDVTPSLSLPSFPRDDERAPGKMVSEQIMTLVSRKLLVAPGSFAIPRSNLLAIKRMAGGGGEEGIVRTEITILRVTRGENAIRCALPTGK